MTGAERRMEIAMAPVLRIEVDMFSGRPNPTLDVRGDEAQRLQELLAQQRQPLNDVRTPDQLGFRGFIVSPEGSGGETCRVNGAILLIGDRAYLDPNKDIQNFIVSILPPDVKAMLLPLLDVR
jgi:hypothetical protein